MLWAGNLAGGRAQYGDDDGLAKVYKNIEIDF